MTGFGGGATRLWWVLHELVGRNLEDCRVTERRLDSMAGGAKRQCGGSGEEGHLQREALETRWAEALQFGIHWFEGNNYLVG